MRKKFKAYLGSALALAIFLASVPLGYLLTTAALASPRSYVIWDANPDRLAGGDGASAKPTNLQNAANGGGDIVKKTDEAIPYYRAVTKGNNAGNGAVFNSGLTQQSVPVPGVSLTWMNSEAVLQALYPYIVTKFDLRADKTNVQLYLRTTQPYFTDIFRAWEGKGTTAWKSFEQKGGVSQNAAANKSKTWYNGYFTVSSYASPEAGVQADIRRLRFELEESDRDDIDAALKAADSTLTFDDLIAFDAASEYSPNYQTVTAAAENGTLSFSPAVQSSPGQLTRVAVGETVTITATPAPGFVTARLSVTDASGGAVAVTKVGENTYTFVVPDKAVTVNALFRNPSAPASYVIWDADPDRLTGEDGASAKPTNIQPAADENGTAVKKTDEAISYFRANTTANNPGNGALFDSGLAQQSVPAPGVSLTWLNNAAVLQALYPYMIAKFDMRSDNPNATFYLRTTQPYKRDVFRAWAGKVTAQWASYEKKGGTEDKGANQNQTWYNAYFAITSYASGSPGVQADIRRLRFELEESDRDDINAALKAADSTLTFDDLIAFDKVSAYSSNTYAAITCTAADNGSARAPAIGRAGETVTVTTTPDSTYQTKSVTVTDADNGAVTVSKAGENTYTFVMPDKAVTIAAVFEKEPDAPPSVNYVIWDANPDKFTHPVPGDVQPSVKVNGQSLRMTDEDVPYYRAVTTGNNMGSGALFVSGITQNSSPEFKKWLNDKAVLQALYPFIVTKFDMRSNNPDATLYLRTAQPYRADIFRAWAGRATADWRTYEKKGGTDDKGDNQNTYNWYNAYFTVSSYASGGPAVQVDIRALRFELEERDRAAIDAALKAAGSTLTFDDLIAYDKVSAYSGNTYESYHKLTISRDEHSDITYTKARLQTGESGESAAVTVTTESGYYIDSITAQSAGGESVALTKGNAGVYTFVMPNDDLHISVTTKAYVKRDFALLWQFSAGTETSAPGFAGTGACPFDSQKINAGDQTAYAFTVTKNEGMATIKGRLNQRIGLNQYLDEAEVVIRLKLDTPSSNRTVTVGVSGSTLTKTVTVGADWTTVRIPLKDLLSGDTLPGLTFSLTERSVGDVLAIGDICIWSQPGLSNDAGFEHIFDISDYEKQETNTLLGTIGHTEMPVDPWNELKLDEQALSWDLAWYYSFQNMAPWIVTPKEEGAGNPYLLTFYGWDVKEDKVAPIDVSACIETGYMEFFIKGNKDGMTVPFAVQSSGGGRKYAPFTVTYDASKARSDGYMRVRIPFTYLADMGLDMSTIAWVSIAGMQDIEDFVLLSSFRLYSHYADVPEPEEPEEEQPPVERDFPLELDASILNARLDIDKRILYVPQNTYIWEVLAALRLDTEEVTVGFFEGDEEPVTDTERELVEGMLLRLYRRGFTVADFQVVIDQAKVAGTGGSNDEETGNVNTGVASAAALPAALAVLSGLTLPVLARRSRRKPKH